MTREEAIRFGENILKVADETTDADAIEFTKMAIEAFKQQEQKEKEKHAYRVATAVGGLMESPKIDYVDEQIIFADNEEEALRIYNELNHCHHYFGEILGRIY